MSNTLGTLFRVTSFGESHGPGIGVVIDGFPAGFPLDLEAIQNELDRRRPGQSHLTTQRNEPDAFQVLSGMSEGKTTGAPLTFWIPNAGQKEQDYDHLEHVFRPSHADFTYWKKYGIRDHRGGGRSSARTTASLVMAGAVASQFLLKNTGMTFQAWTHSVGEISLQHIPASFELETEASRMTRCPDAPVAARMEAAILEVRKAGDSLGGTVGCRIRNVPAGLGEPLFGKAHAQLGAALLSINAVKGIEFGDGFEGTLRKGSGSNDIFEFSEGQIRTRTNHSGGIQGGITNGEDILFRLAFKPTSTIMQDQESVDDQGQAVLLKGKGRHDPCVLPRAVPVVEAVAAIVMLDLWMQDRASRV